MVKTSPFLLLILEQYAFHDLSRCQGEGIASEKSLYGFRRSCSTCTITKTQVGVPGPSTARVSINPRLVYGPAIRAIMMAQLRVYFDDDIRVALRGLILIRNCVTIPRLFKRYYHELLNCPRKSLDYRVIYLL